MFDEPCIEDAFVLMLVNIPGLLLLSVILTFRNNTKL